jgi:hypothetical protein
VTTVCNGTGLPSVFEKVRISSELYIYYIYIYIYVYIYICDRSPTWYPLQEKGRTNILVNVVLKIPPCS